MTDTHSERAMNRTDQNDPGDRADDANRPGRDATVTVTLEGDARPCADCGQAVAEPDLATMVKAERVRQERASVVMLATCSACRERDQTACDLAEKYLRTGVTVGDRRYGLKDAARLLVDAWTALDAAGFGTARFGGGEAASGVALASLVVHLSSQVGGLRWRDRLNPPLSLVAEPRTLVHPGTANADRWGHLDEADRARLREGMVRVLAERVARQAPPVALTPPQLRPDEVGTGGPRSCVTDGCFYCGLVSVTMSALDVMRRGGQEDAARAVWSLRRITPSTVGGAGSGSQVTCWLCPTCSRAADDVGSASSARALTGALAGWLGRSRLTLAGDEVLVAGLQAWGALVAQAQQTGRPGPGPNEGPWAHLTEKERERLEQEWGWGGSSS